MNRKNTRRRSRTDWKRVDALKDSDIDLSDAPELGPDFFANAILWPGPKEQITLRLDPDVLKFFRRHGKGYQTTINAVLRKYMEAHARFGQEKNAEVRERRSGR
ncbi:MAG TPA: BrnA antitoxin family protein [Candidatus Sulfotelmatobacter sp.]|nr:BrnA antitoxin family protein [Candidatus Sulfotelmatobacter sp.]